LLYHGKIEYFAGIC